MQKKNEIIQLITAFQKTAIGVATNFENTTYEDYEYARNQLLSQPSLHGVIPEWVVKNRTGSQFRSSMQAISDTYKGRRSFIYDSLSELIERSQQGGNQPVSLSLNEVNSAIKNDSLDSIWKKIQLRRENDPEGAITAQGQCWNQH